MSTSTIAKPPAKSMWRKQFAVVSRWLHLYLSMVTFAILFFFAATGLTLNHTEWFEGQQRTVRLKGEMDKAWLKGEPDKLRIVEKLRAAHRIQGALTDFRLDEFQATVSFKGPGYAADAFLDRDSGRYELNETRMGWGAIINDLHKGRDSGKAWSVLLDASAVLMCVVSLTGFVLIFFMGKKRGPSLLAAVLGCLASYAVYLYLVP